MLIPSEGTTCKLKRCHSKPICIFFCSLEVHTLKVKEEQKQHWTSLTFIVWTKKLILIFGLTNPSTLNKIADCYLVETVLFPLICSLCGFALQLVSSAWFFAFAELSVFSNPLWPNGKKNMNTEMLKLKVRNHGYFPHQTNPPGKAQSKSHNYPFRGRQFCQVVF